MKYIRLVSDIHLDFDLLRFHQTRAVKPGDLTINDPIDILWFPEPMEGDDDTALVIAGDIWTNRYFLDKTYPDGEPWIKKLSIKFKHVILVLGNHDYWGKNLLYEADAIKLQLSQAGLTNVTLLEKSLIVIDQVKFVGGTLWTDYHRGDPLMIGRCRSEFSKDFTSIKYGKSGRCCNPKDMYEVHMNTKKYIFEHTKRDHTEQKVMVVTHMAPSYQSISKSYKTWEYYYSNYHYFSDLEKRIKADGKDIDYWVHGHVHHAVDYMLEPNVRVCCQPRGYSGYDQTDYDPKFRIEL